jgi:hypothetical protein
MQFVRSADAIGAEITGVDVAHRSDAILRPPQSRR